MSLYQGFAQQKGFGAYLVDIPDPSKKIREQGLTAMGHMKDEIEWQKQQADKVATAFDQDSASFEKQFEQNFETKQAYAQRLAEGKWRNFETAVRNAEIRQKQKDADFDALLSLTKSGASLVKQRMIHNRKMTDQFAEQLYRDYGVGRKGFEAIKNAENQIINNNTSLQALLREYEISGDVPMDVIAKIRRSGGYMNLAVTKNEAIRFGRSLTGRIGARSNELINLPGMESPMSLNDALATGGPTVDMIVDELIRTEIQDDTGNPRFSNKVIALSGLGGAEGYIQATKAVYTRKANENLVKNEWKDRNLETIEVIRSFIGPENGTRKGAGVAGIDAAVIYFAGGENATGRQKKRALSRVVNALDDALRNQDITWNEVEGLETHIVKTAGAPGGVMWSKLFKREWTQLKKAGAAFHEAEDNDLALKEADQSLEAKTFLADVKTVVNEQNPSVKELTRLLSVATGRGELFKESKTYIAAALARGRTAENDALGTGVLMARAERNEIITSEEIDKWNFSKPVDAQVRAAVAKRNQMLPQTGTDGTRERLEFVVKAQLNSLIKRKNAWHENSTHNDARIRGMQLASGYYRAARETGKSHEDSYTYALQEITQDIQGKRNEYFHVENVKGVKTFKGANPTKVAQIEFKRDEVGKELHRDPGLIYTKPYFDAREISAKASKGIYQEVHPTALLIQSLTRGKINAVDAMQAQLQRQRDEETKEFGAPRTELLPDEYIKRYKAETDRISPMGQRLLNNYSEANVNRAYTSSGYQPPNQEFYYKKVNKIIQTGDMNNVITPDGKAGKALKVLKYNISDRTVGEVLRLMENGHITNAGNALFDYQGLAEAVTDSGVGLGTQFNLSTQQKLQNVRFKKHGLKGFPHVEPNEYNVGMTDNLYQAVNTDKIDENYFRSYAACGDAACKFMQENPHLFPHLGGKVNE